MCDRRNRQPASRRCRRRIQVEGIVQGVGFRPFIYQSAVHLGLDGWVCNDSSGVTIEAEGPIGQLDRFITVIQAEKPPLAVIHQLTATEIPSVTEAGFRICQSRSGQIVRTQVAPDTFVCADCLRELFDHQDRRFRYPFINCTNCGPRYTIVTGIPYDRPLTTMADFPMCRDCRAEYDNPASRRFHAQPNACSVCGPQLSLVTANGQDISGQDPLSTAVQALKSGRIIAVKGLGGYHLAVDAANADAVQELRRRKQRDEKPFALMARDLEVVQRIVCCNDLEARLLTGPERPIVLLEKRHDHGIAEGVAPGNRYFGVMLPYTPLHHLLLTEGAPVLIMTSANLADEPIAFEDEDAQRRLSGIADLFLVHNRRIETRTDDSIARVMAGQPLLLRRSRGYVPRMVKLPWPQEATLAVGAELKSTICLTRGDQAYLSQHIGDLKNLEVYQSFTRTVSHLREILDVTPQWIAHDLHPDYYSTRYAAEESELPGIAVQHHHAHLASCLAEHGCQDPAIGMIFDGIGFGTDGHIWGGEFLLGDLSGFERAGHFRYLPMPGGDLATREPWRMALACLRASFTEVPLGNPAFVGLPESEIRLVSQALDSQINTPLTSSCGRLFDAAAALLGLHQRVTFEGQAAMALEMIADPDMDRPYAYRLSFEEGGGILFDPRPLIRALVEDQQVKVPIAQIAGRFHATLAVMIEEVCNTLRSRTGISTVVLSGGVFQNCLLTVLSRKRLERSAFTVLTHSLVPPNDGGLALGQAAVAGRTVAKG